MIRRTFLSALLATATLMGSTGMAAAASYTEDVVAQLVNLGFSDITAETTLLGRVKIRASRADGMREVVINPRTGEVLRDIWIPSGNGAPRTVLNDIDDDRQGTSSSGRDDDGNSGSGSGDDNGSSGSGSGGDGDDNSGSGSGGDDSDDDSGSGSGGDDSDDDSGDDSDGGDDREDRDDRDKNDRD